MCRETKREPAWVSAIRLAFLRGQVDVDGVMEEANLIPGYERTVRDVLSTMADRTSWNRCRERRTVTFRAPSSSSPSKRSEGTCPPPRIFAGGWRSAETLGTQ
ncbi:hypothetical protein [Natronorubrum sp. FCH18a]|uniref:hypothetical protein n=1 Tax=Natronorubrum sp. FCH18a TaxID=3447018 RepID=UPI003F5142B3